MKGRVVLLLHLQVKADMGLAAALGSEPLEICIFNEAGLRALDGSTSEGDLIGAIHVDLWPLLR